MTRRSLGRSHSTRRRSRSMSRRASPARRRYRSPERRERRHLSPRRPPRSPSRRRGRSRSPVGRGDRRRLSSHRSPQQGRGRYPPTRRSLGRSHSTRRRSTSMSRRASPARRRYRSPERRERRHCSPRRPPRSPIQVNLEPRCLRHFKKSSSRDRSVRPRHSRPSRSSSSPPGGAKAKQRSRRYLRTHPIASSSDFSPSCSRGPRRSRSRSCSRSGPSAPTPAPQPAPAAGVSIRQSHSPSPPTPSIFRSSCSRSRSRSRSGPAPAPAPAPAAEVSTVCIRPSRSPSPPPPPMDAITFTTAIVHRSRSRSCSRSRSASRDRGPKPTDGRLSHRGRSGRLSLRSRGRGGRAAALGTIPLPEDPSSISSAFGSSTSFGGPERRVSTRRSSFLDFTPAILDHKLRPKNKLKTRYFDLPHEQGTYKANIIDLTSIEENDSQSTMHVESEVKAQGKEKILTAEEMLQKGVEYTNGSIDQTLAATLIDTFTNLSGNDCVSWEDVCGLQDVKDTIEIEVVLPWKHPERFRGLRSASRGVLMYGPPGTGKTMIGKCIASQMEAKFFSVTASSLITKWAGDAERAVKTLFQLARALQPSIIFIDEIDALLGVRGENEKEWERRVKTEFLTELDGCKTKQDDKVLFIGATNLPKSIDPAFIRRFTTRLYVPLPQHADRKVMLKNIMSSTEHSLTEADVGKIATETEGYSGSDLHQLCRWASKNFSRKLQRDQHGRIVLPQTDIPVAVQDFLDALKVVQRTVPSKDVKALEAYSKGLL